MKVSLNLWLWAWIWIVAAVACVAFGGEKLIPTAIICATIFSVGATIQDELRKASQPPEDG